MLVLDYDAWTLTWNSRTIGASDQKVGASALW